MSTQFFVGTSNWFQRVTQVVPQTDGVTLQGENGLVRITFVGRSVRLRASSGEFNGNPFSSVEPKEREIPSANCNEGEHTVSIQSADLLVTIEKASGEIAIKWRNGSVVVESVMLGWEDGRPTVTSKLDADDRIYGTGLRSQPKNLRGRRVQIWTKNNPNPKHSGDSSYAVVPFAVVRRPGRSYGVFHDNSAFAEFDLGELNKDRLSFQAFAGEIDCFIIPGPKPVDVLRSYTDLTGRLELPPQWVYVFGHSRYGMSSDFEVVRRVVRYNERQLPLWWVAIDLDYMIENRPWTWNDQKFGAPGKLSSELNRRGLHTVLIMDPLVPIVPENAPHAEMLERGLFCKLPDGSTNAVIDGFAGPAHIPDGANPETIAYLAERFAAATKLWQVDGWWLDKQELAGVAKVREVVNGDLGSSQSALMGDTETLNGDAVIHHGGYTEWIYHNHFCIDFAYAAVSGQLQAEPNRRPFVLSRAQFAGMQRFSSGWTGDNYADFGSLGNAIPQLVNLGLSGLPFYGTDIGGFFGHCSTELLIRWVQFGVFTPLARIHSFKTTFEQAPWHRGNQARDIIRKYLELRSRLHLLTNDLFWKAMEDGTPMMRPMFWDYPDEQIPNQPWVQFEYLWGPFLVAPVVDEGHTGKQVYLPGEGRLWYDFWTRREYLGGKSYHIEAPKETLPLFVPAGTILPMGDVLQNAHTLETDLFFNVYSGASGSHLLHLDDGETRKYKDGEYSTILLTYQGTRSSGEMVLGERQGNYTPPTRSITIRFLVVDEPTSVQVDGVDAYWSFHPEDSGSITIMLADDGKRHEISYRV